jgi:hypothetical protein
MEAHTQAIGPNHPSREEQLAEAKRVCYPTFERAKLYAKDKRFQVGVGFFFAGAFSFMTLLRGLRRKPVPAQRGAGDPPQAP